MRELAQKIRRGLATEGVVEACEAWGACSENGVVVANVVGLALIGAVGKECAVSMLSYAFEESVLNDEESEMTQKVVEALGLADTTQTEDLAARHMEGTAAVTIAEELEAGTFRFEGAE